MKIDDLYTKLQPYERRKFYENDTKFLQQSLTSQVPFIIQSSYDNLARLFKTDKTTYIDFIHRIQYFIKYCYTLEKYMLWGMYLGEYNKNAFRIMYFNEIDIEKIIIEVENMFACMHYDIVDIRIEK